MTQVFEREAPEHYTLYVGVDEVVEATGEHPFWVVGQGWTNVEDLQEGDHLLNSDGRGLRLAAVEFQDRPLKVHNFSVRGLHTYFAGNSQLLVHNGGEKPVDYVYRHLLPGGNVNYIGITNDPERRAGEHRGNKLKMGKTMKVITEKIPHGKARTIEATLIYERWEAAQVAADNVDDFNRMKIEDSLKEAGLLNKNRGRVKDRWENIDIDDYIIEDGREYDITTRSARKFVNVKEVFGCLLKEVPFMSKASGFWLKESTTVVP